MNLKLRENENAGLSDSFSGEGDAGLCDSISGEGMLVSMIVFQGGMVLFCLSIAKSPSSHLLSIDLGLSLLAVPF